MSLMALAACAAPSSHTAPPSIALLVANIDRDFSRETAEGFTAGAQTHGVQVDVVGPPIVDGPREVQMFQQLVARHTSGISLFTLQPDLFVDPLTQATGAGTVVIAVDNPAPAGAGVSLLIANDNVALGRMLADQVIAELPAQAHGTVVVGTSAPGASVLDERADGIRREFADRMPGIRVFGPFDSKSEVSANLAAWRTLVAVQPDALAFMGTEDADGWNLATVRRETGGKWLAGAFDLDPRALAAVKSHDLVLVSPEHYLEGALAGRLQARAALGDGTLPTGWLYVPGLAVSPANVDAVIARQASAQSKCVALLGQADRILDDISADLRPLDQAAS